MGDHYKASQFIAAIPGTSGIVSVIARRVGCDWATVRKYINKYPAITAAYLAECETIKDLAESVVIKNMELAAQQQQESKIVDAADARWYLTVKAADRGYGDKKRIELMVQDLDRTIERELARLAGAGEVTTIEAPSGEERITE